MRNDWLNRTTKQLISNTSPGDMLRRFGAPFDGSATSNAQWIYDPDLAAVAGFPSKYWIISGDTVSLMDAGQRATVDAAIVSAARDAIANEFDDVDDKMRALALSLLDVVNFLSGQIESIKTAIEGAASLGALRTAVTAIPDAPQRTAAQLKTLLRSKLGT